MAHEPDAPGSGAASAVPATVTGAGDRLVLVHGFTQNRRCWAPVDADLAGRYEVVCVDAPGHGDAAALALSLDDAAGVYADAVGPAVWVGYSLGGRLALHVAVARPDAVRALVLVGRHRGLPTGPHAGSAGWPTTPWPTTSRPWACRRSSTAGWPWTCSPASTPAPTTGPSA